MLGRILSGDYPRSPILTVALLLILFVLASAPFLFAGAQPLNVAAKIQLPLLIDVFLRPVAERGRVPFRDTHAALRQLDLRHAIG